MKTHMKYISLIVLVVAVFVTGCGSKCIEDSGIRAHRVTTVGVFDQIKISGKMKLILTQDSTYHIKVEADSNIIEAVKFAVSGTELRIELADEKYCGTDSIAVFANIGELKKLELKGNVQVQTEGVLHVNDLSILAKGANALTLNLNASKLNTQTEGVTQLHLSGQTGTHELISKGTLKMEAFDFVAGIYNLNIEGIGNANINVLNELKVNTKGTSSIRYKGNPKKVDEKKTGATTLEKVN